jgi:cytochrome c oxidase cbb3-type subunit 3/ubiquinol-cytochrome c reductase cytochrome c subunit
MNSRSKALHITVSLAAALLVAACGGAAETGESPAGAFDPDLFPSGQLVPAADVFAAQQQGVDILFVDARTGLDYEFGHIPGAVNVPYHSAEEHLSDLPKDRWIVTYCECPHAEAVQVADTLTKNGFEYVRVIDEGLQGWRDQGGELVKGAEPGA